MDIYTEVDEIMKNMPTLARSIGGNKIAMYEDLKTYYGNLIAHIPSSQAYEYMIQKIVNYLLI